MMKVTDEIADSMFTGDACRQRVAYDEVGRAGFAATSGSQIRFLLRQPPAVDLVAPSP